MKKQIINLPNVKKPTSGFSHIVKANGFIFLSSQLSSNLKTGSIIKGDVRAQTKRAMDNIKYLLEGAGSGISNIVKTVIYFRNLNDRKDINEIYQQYFKPDEQPAKTSVQAKSPIEGIDIEIEVIAIDKAAK